MTADQFEKALNNLLAIALQDGVNQHRMNVGQMILGLELGKANLIRMVQDVEIQQRMEAAAQMAPRIIRPNGA